MSRRSAVNGSMTGSMIEQFPMAAVVVNCPPPFKGALTACHPAPAIHHRHAATTTAGGGAEGSKVSPPALSSTGARLIHAISLLAFHLEVSPWRQASSSACR
jgi:hypothetical protein